MSEPGGLVTSESAFAELLVDVQRQLDTSVRLPDWPFVAPTAFATIYEYDRMLGGSFGLVVKALALTHGDRSVAVVGIEPPVSYYRPEYGLFPGFRIPPDSSDEDYAANLRYEPGGDPTGAMAFTTNVLAIAGTSGAWAIWGQRDWEVGLLVTPQREGPWLEQPVPAFGRDVDLESIRSPAGWGTSLSDEVRSRFWQNVRDRGSGP